MVGSWLETDTLLKIQFNCKGVVHKLRLQIFWPFLTPPPPWLTALLNKICHIYLVTLTFDDPPSPMAVNVVCERPLIE